MASTRTPPLRLDADERRKAIVAAAVPLFARKGFTGTTTRELAEAAGISEALLFKHFPSKQLLYREIMMLGCEGDPALEQLAALSPSTATLVHMVGFMVRRCVLGEEGPDPAPAGALECRQRLVLHSFLEDGAYARELYERIFERMHPCVTASVEAAVASGDLHPTGVAPANRFWFAQHVAAMIAFSGLSGAHCFPYAGPPEQLIDDASAFILRGLGMTDAAIAAALAQPAPADPALPAAAD
jgi:AcrR family transcriptional regulator